MLLMVILASLIAAKGALCAPASTEPASMAYSDRMTSPSGSADPYFCASNADCTIKVRTTCCGDAPTCANQNAAVFEAPDCTSIVSICGFPAATGCQCIDSHCGPVFT